MQTIVLIALATFASTLLGGLFALRWKDKLHLVLGFSAGAVIGVAFFDLLPEALELAGEKYEISTVTAIVAFAFLCYLLIDRFVLLHAHTEEETTSTRATLGAATLSIHSMLDGLGIGFAFQVSPAVGIIVTTAVLTHDFSDGINTINLVLKNGGSWRTAFRWLIVDAIAPSIGMIVASFFTLSSSALGLILASFCGFFLYLGASDLLPESHHRHPTLWTSCATALGIGVLYLAVSLAGI